MNQITHAMTVFQDIHIYQKLMDVCYVTKIVINALVKNRLSAQFVKTTSFQKITIHVLKNALQGYMVTIILQKFQYVNSVLCRVLNVVKDLLNVGHVVRVFIQIQSQTLVENVLVIVILLILQFKLSNRIQQFQKSTVQELTKIQIKLVL